MNNNIEFKCSNISCPIRNTCLRFKIKPANSQKYKVFNFDEINNEIYCSYIIKIKPNDEILD